MRLLKYIRLIPLVMLAALFISAVPSPFVVKKFSDYPNGPPLVSTDLMLLQRGGTYVNAFLPQVGSNILSSPIWTGVATGDGSGIFNLNVSNVTTLSVSNFYVTNLFATTINSVTNFDTYDFSTNIFATTINAVTNINNYDFTTNLFVTNLFAQTVNAVTNISDFFFTTNFFTTNLFATTIDATTNINNYSFVTNLFATTVNNVTNISDFTFTTNLFVTNLFATTVTAVTNFNTFNFSTNLFSTNIYTTNLFATTVNNVTNISQTDITTNLFVTNLFATTVNAVTNISQFSFLTNLYVTNLTVQNFNLTTNGFVLSYGGIGTNETWVGPTTFVDTNKSGVIDILDADGTTIIAGFDTNFNGFFGRGYAVSTNSWSGATNAVDLTHADTYYVSYIPVSLTGVSGKLGAYSSGVSLSISNAASTNITIDFASFKTSDGTRSSVITNATIGEFWIKYSPVWVTTQLVARPTFY